jgi:hypothetical protein
MNLNLESRLLSSLVYLSIFLKGGLVTSLWARFCCEKVSDEFHIQTNIDPIKTLPYFSSKILINSFLILQRAITRAAQCFMYI